MCLTQTFASHSIYGSHPHQLLLPLNSRHNGITVRQTPILTLLGLETRGSLRKGGWGILKGLTTISWSPEPTKAFHNSLILRPSSSNYWVQPCSFYCSRHDPSVHSLFHSAFSQLSLYAGLLFVNVTGFFYRWIITYHAPR